MSNFSSPKSLPHGSLMMDVAGLDLTDQERLRLRHPLVGGVILFARNYESPQQLAALTADIRSQRTPALLIAVDQEGGRVQRFREGFTPIPPMGLLGKIWDEETPEKAQAIAQDIGLVLGSELKACGVDLSFTPVLDINYGTSRVVSDRSFHREPAVVGQLAQALLVGLKEAGLLGVGKHFPGHGWALADSHVDFPVDERSYEEIFEQDLYPYRNNLLTQLGGVMSAHVIYKNVDFLPSSFSPFWQKIVLRDRLGFNGVIFSDDLTMQAAGFAGDIVGRVGTAYEAGSDMVLVCNHPDWVGNVLNTWQPAVRVDSQNRVGKLCEEIRKSAPVPLSSNSAYLLARDTVISLTKSK